MCSIGMLGRTDDLMVVGPRGTRELLETVFRLTDASLAYNYTVVELLAEQSFIELQAKAAGPGELEVSPDHKALQTILEPVEQRLGINIHAAALKHRTRTFGYVFQERQRPGTLDIREATARGAKGRMLGQLKAGHDVQLPDGKVICSRDVVGPAPPAFKIVILQDTCNSSYLLPHAIDCEVLIHECTYHEALEEKALLQQHTTAAWAGDVARVLRANTLLLTHFSARYAVPTPEEVSQINQRNNSKDDVKQLTDMVSKVNLDEQTETVEADSNEQSISISSKEEVVGLKELVAEAASTAGPSMNVYAARDFLVLNRSKEGFLIS